MSKHGKHGRPEVRDAVPTRSETSAAAPQPRKYAPAAVVGFAFDKSRRSMLVTARDGAWYPIAGVEAGDAGPDAAMREAGVLFGGELMAATAWRRRLTIEEPARFFRMIVYCAIADISDIVMRAPRPNPQQAQEGLHLVDALAVSRIFAGSRYEWVVPFLVEPESPLGTSPTRGSVDLLSVRSERFMAHRDTTIDLDRQGIVLVTGKVLDDPSESANGCGKPSAVVESILFAGYGRTLRGLGGDDVVMNGERDCLVTLELRTARGERVRILRPQNHGKS